MYLENLSGTLHQKTNIQLKRAVFLFKLADLYSYPDWCLKKKINKERIIRKKDSSNFPCIGLANFSSSNLHINGLHRKKKFPEREKNQGVFSGKPNITKMLQPATKNKLDSIQNKEVVL